MMQVMIHGSVDPFTKPTPIKTFWINFITCVSIHIINNRKQKENRQMQAMNWNSKKEKQPLYQLQLSLPRDEKHKLPTAKGWSIDDEQDEIF